MEKNFCKLCGVAHEPGKDGCQGWPNYEAKPGVVWINPEWPRIFGVRVGDR